MVCRIDGRNAESRGQITTKMRTFLCKSLSLRQSRIFRAGVIDSTAIDVNRPLCRHPAEKRKARIRDWPRSDSVLPVRVEKFHATVVSYLISANPETKKKDVVWFALNDDRPLFAFAGIWTEF
jgi:hypothetical protein